jgi:sugar lactone lactonase YvrE
LFCMKKIYTYFFIIGFGVLLIRCSKRNQKPGNTGPADNVLAIAAIAPSTGGFNTYISITGKNFNTNPALDSVQINSKAANVISATATTLVVSVPLAAGTGAVSVTVNGSTVTGPVFNYTAALVVSTVAGNGIGDLSNGASETSTINYPYGVAIDKEGTLYVSEYNRIKKITSSGIISVLAGDGKRGFADTIGALSEFNPVMGIAVDSQGNVYVADRDNERIRKISSTGAVSTLAGDGTNGYADATGANARFNSPVGVAVDAQGNVYVADEGNQRVRKITAGGVVSTLAGDGNAGFQDGPGNQAEFHDVAGIAVDQQGNVYVSEDRNQRIRKIAPSGMVSTLAGNGVNDYVDGLGTNAEFSSPLGLAVDLQGNVYVADQTNSMIRKISPAGLVSTLAGSYEIWAFADGPVAVAQFNFPHGVAVDKQGNVYVADNINYRIRKISFE